jgi:hypothetical protein
MDPEPGSPKQLTSGQDTWSARCVETRTPGAASGPGKRADRKTSTAPRSDSTLPPAWSARSSTPSSSPTFAREIVEDLTAALVEFEAVAAALEASGVGE